MGHTMALTPEKFADASIQDLAGHCGNELDVLLWKINDEEIVEERLSSAAYVPLKNALVSIARQIEKIKAATVQAEHDTLWRRDDDETEHTHQRAEYFHGVAPGGRL